MRRLWKKDKILYWILSKNTQNYHIILQKEFVNVQNGTYFRQPIYELAKHLENQQKNRKIAVLFILAGPSVQFTS